MFRHNHNHNRGIHATFKTINCNMVFYEFYNHQVVVLLKPYCLWITYMYFLVYNVICRTVITHLRVEYLKYQI